jgi:RNA polymerase-binding transcription factor DksA
MITFEEDMKRRIEVQLATLNPWIDVLKRECLRDELKVAGHSTPDNLDSIEVAEDDDSRHDLLQRLVEKTTKLNEALERIPDRLYGICTACGKPIHRQRLETLPEAELCLKCHKLWERFGGLETADCPIA